MSVETKEAANLGTKAQESKTEASKTQESESKQDKNAPKLKLSEQFKNKLRNAVRNCIGDAKYVRYEVRILENSLENSEERIARQAYLQSLIVNASGETLRDEIYPALVKSMEELSLNLPVNPPSRETPPFKRTDDIEDSLHPEVREHPVYKAFANGVNAGLQNYDKNKTGLPNYDKDKHGDISTEKKLTFDLKRKLIIATLFSLIDEFHVQKDALPKPSTAQKATQASTGVQASYESSDNNWTGNCTYGFNLHVDSCGSLQQRAGNDSEDDSPAQGQHTRSSGYDCGC